MSLSTKFGYYKLTLKQTLQINEDDITQTLKADGPAASTEYEFSIGECRPDQIMDDTQNRIADRGDYTLTYFFQNGTRIYANPFSFTTDLDCGTMYYTE